MRVIVLFFFLPRAHYLPAVNDIRISVFVLPPIKAIGLFDLVSLHDRIIRGGRAAHQSIGM